MIFKFLLAFFLIAQAHSDESQMKLENICGPYFLTSEKSIFASSLKFNKNELLLICGADTPGWKNIPPWQALENIKNNLRKKGYYSPSILYIKNKIIIDPGNVSRIKTIIYKNTPPDFFDVKLSGIDNATLNTESIDQLKAWGLSRMRSIDYPCPQVTVEASVDNQTVIVNMLSGPKTPIHKVIRPNTPGIHPNIWTRFDAFQIGDEYKENLFMLTSRRLAGSNLVNYSDFINECSSVEEKMGIFEERITLSQPRSLIFAIGASTEELGIIKTSWRHSRIDQYASQVEASVYLSTLEKSFQTQSHWYPLPNSPRIYILPTFTVERNSEVFYTSVTQSLSSQVGYYHDNSIHQYQLEAGPSYNIEDTLEGSGPPHVKYLSFDSTIALLSHDYELYQSIPQSGYQITADWNTRQKGLGSPTSGNRYQLKGTYLINWGHFSPPLYVLGFRFELATLATPALENAPKKLRLYLGGNEDIRGFARKSINNQTQGYLTTAYLGTEIRALQLLPYQLQPLLFIDVAQTGTDTFTLDPTLFWSPGTGLRWQSPFGSFRATGAYGLIAQKGLERSLPDGGWNFFLSYGQEF